MKKTLITLLALSGIAMGDTRATIDTTDTTLKAYFDFSTGNSLTAGSMEDTDWGEKANWNATGKYGESTTTTTHPYTGKAGLTSQAFTISFDINQAANGTLMSVGCGNANNAWKSFAIHHTKNEETGVSTLSAQFQAFPDDAITTTLTMGNADWTTLTMVGSANSEDSALVDMAFYVNGKLIATYTTPDNASNVNNNTTFNNLQFGYLGDATQSANTNIDNILVYSRALSATEVADLQVPEPTTATLSLLALAGLAARRRRK